MKIPNTLSMENTKPTINGDGLRQWLLHGMVGLLLLFAAITLSEMLEGLPVPQALLFVPFVTYLLWKGFGFSLRHSCIVGSIVVLIEAVIIVQGLRSVWVDALTGAVTMLLVLRAARH